MKCPINRVFWTFIFLTVVDAAELQIKEELQTMAEQIEILKTLHLTDVTKIKREIEELKGPGGRTLLNSTVTSFLDLDDSTTLPGPAVAKNHPGDKEASTADDGSTSHRERNERATLQWERAALQELRGELRELRAGLNSSALLRQLHTMRSELKQALVGTSDLVQLARTQESRLDQLAGETARLRHESQQQRGQLAEARVLLARLTNEVKTKQLEELSTASHNDVYDFHGEKSEDSQTEHSHKHRHNKMVHAQMARLARGQGQLGVLQRGLQAQLLGVQRRLDRCEEPNWNLLSAKLEFLQLDTKNLRDEIRNTTQKVIDFDKVHASVLELREDLESIENKADKTIPEFRKEISKLDVSFAQLNAQSSYLKEDQENLRQSVKAIAVSVSNAVDRAELDRLALQRVNESVGDLFARSKQHYYRLNDHILKSEASHDMNLTEAIPLPELMGEVKELQPVQQEYEDLVSQLPKDCSSISGLPGRYLIRPSRAPLDTWCNNGSTLLQRRFNGTVEFNRKFAAYAHGFGDPTSEYWLGLDSMHHLTADNCSSMRIDMTDIYGGTWYAQYEHFFVGSADSGYILEVSGFKGNASDAFEYQNHMEFSTIDRDRDISNTHCAGNYEGGWWFSHCQHVNINGKYTLGLTWFDAVRNEWIAVASSEMRQFRRPACA